MADSISIAAILPLVIKFLDQFPHALDVIVSCARKTEVALWDHLFSVVGKPKDLFEICLADGRLRTATSYLIILQTMQPLVVGGKDTIRLLQKAMDESDYELCKELVRFLSSIDSKFFFLLIVSGCPSSNQALIRHWQNIARSAEHDQGPHGE